MQHTVSAWHYQEKLFPEPLYTNLKIQTTSSTSTSSQHLQQPQHIQHSIYPDSTSHHHQSPQLVHDTSTISPYHHSNYPYRSPADTTAVSSTEPDFGSSVTSNQTSGVIHSSGSLHQRRGSLQLWQFLVALLDEPASRLIK